MFYEVSMFIDLFSNQISGAPSTSIGIDNIYEFGAKLLFSAVEWAKNIPFFGELGDSDQVSFYSTTFITNPWQITITKRHFHQFFL